MPHNDIGRPTGSKIAYVGGKYYLVLVWSDLFTANISESELRAPRARNQRSIYLKEATPQQAKVLEAAWLKFSSQPVA